MALTTWISDQLSILLGCECGEIAAYMVGLSGADARAYAENLLDAEQAATKAFVKELEVRLDRAASHPPAQPKQHAAATSSKQSNASHPSYDRSMMVASSSTSAAPHTQKAQLSSSTGNGAGSPPDTAATAGAVPGPRCDCYATRHALFCNCTSCGKILCVLEASELCNFCGARLRLANGAPVDAALLRRTRASAPTAEILPQPSGGDESCFAPSSVVLPAATLGGAAEASAIARNHLERLLHYDRTSAARTRVTDDAVDPFSDAHSGWLSPAERDAAQAEATRLNEAALHRPRGMRLTLEFGGGEGDGSSTAAAGVSVRDEDYERERGTALRLKELAAAPVRRQGLGGSGAASTANSSNGSGGGGSSRLTVTAPFSGPSAAASLASSTSGRAGGGAVVPGTRVFENHTLHGRAAQAYAFLLSHTAGPPSVPSSGHR